MGVPEKRNIKKKELKRGRPDKRIEVKQVHMKGGKITLARVVEEDAKGKIIKAGKYREIKNEREIDKEKRDNRINQEVGKAHGYRKGEWRRNDRIGELEATEKPPRSR